MTSDFTGLQLDDWAKGKMIGSGSFGTVHLAMNKTTGTLFVVKSAQTEVGSKFLKNEANILENLDSPYVVQFLGKHDPKLKNDEKKFQIFMEYMGGGSLLDISEKFGGVLDENIIRLYTKEILQGLKYLHENGIVHCDLKCKNILVGSTGNVKLADFGCAKNLINSKNIVQDTKNFIGGSPLFMAPEVLRNEKLDFSADIWSLGCTVIEMATNKPPWSEEFISNPMSAILKISRGDDRPRFPTHFSEEGLDFLKKCFEKNPKNRINAEELLKHPFILKKNLEKNSLSSKEKDSSSPASVLETEIFDKGFETSELKRNLIPYFRLDQRSEKRQKFEEFEFMSSENWVTVRS